MGQTNGTFIFVGTYPSEAAAQGDYQVVKALHSQGIVGTYDAAVVTKDDKGKVHVHKDETATKHGFWGGAAVGAVVGIIFPPALLGSAIVGAGAGALAGHLSRGMPRSDVKKLGDFIDSGQAALVVVGEDKVEEAVEQAATQAINHTAQALNVSPEELAADLQQAGQS